LAASVASWGMTARGMKPQASTPSLLRISRM
jgi:hypothetical protein